MPGSFKLRLEICPKPLFKNEGNRKVFDLEENNKTNFDILKIKFIIGSESYGNKTKEMYYSLRLSIK